MKMYQIFLKDGDSFKCSDLSNYHIKNLIGCRVVKGIKIIKKGKK